MSAELSEASPIKASPIEHVVSITRSLWTDACVALYAYGSTARDEMDDWSDFDVCLVVRPDNHLSVARNWMIRMNQEYGQKVDTIALPEELLQKDAPWDLSFVRWSLREKAQLLLGRDIRDQIRMPSHRNLQLSCAMVTMASVRRIYGFSRNQAFPEVMPPVTLAPDWTCPAGNLAWAVCAAIMHLLRSILFFEQGILVPAKAAIAAEMRSKGEGDLAKHAETILQIRKQVPRYQAMPEMPKPVKQIAAAIPELVQRFRTDLSNAGLQDPSYELDGKSLYNPDGSLRRQVSTL